MNMVNGIVIAIIGIIMALAIYKIVIDKKKGVRCSGCPDSGRCSACNTYEETP